MKNQSQNTLELKIYLNLKSVLNEIFID